MKRRRWLLLAVLAVSMAGIAAVAVVERTVIRARYVRWTLAHAPESQLPGRMKALDPRVLEELAFDLDPADKTTRAYRQAALDELLDRRRPVVDDSPRSGDESHLSAPEVDDALKVRLLRETRGLKCDFKLSHDEWPGTDAMREAAAEAVFVDPDPWVSLQACQYLRFAWKESALPELRRACAAPFAASRLEACMALEVFRDDANVPVLVRSLEDRSERVRIAAASALAHHGSAAGAQVLVDGLLGDSPEWAAQTLGLLREKRAVAALVRCWDYRRIGLAVLVEVTGADLPIGASWREWLEAHKAELPEQLVAHARPSER